MLNLGETFPNFTASSTLGELDLYEYLGKDWGVVFSHPADFTPVCVTELGRMAQLSKDFAKRNVKTVCLSIDTIGDHHGWVEDIKKVSGCQVPFPLVSDVNGDISEKVGMLDSSADKRVTVRGGCTHVCSLSPDNANGFLSVPCTKACS